MKEILYAIIISLGIGLFLIGCSGSLNNKNQAATEANISEFFANMDVVTSTNEAYFQL